MKLNTAKLIIGLFWGIGFLISFIILIAQIFSGLYENPKVVFDWYTPIVAPILGIIIVGFQDDFRNPDPNAAEKTVTLPYFIITFILILLYNGILIGIFLFSVYGNRIEYYRQSGLLLGLIQATITGAITLLFKTKN